MIVPSSILKSREIFFHFLSSESISAFDFGCSTGGGTQLLQKKMGIKAMGFDINMKKLRQAHEHGCICCNADILDIPDAPFVDFTIILHMLEHLHSCTDAYKIIAKACTVSRNSVYIKQPFFDADDQLQADGLKTSYSDWKVHRNLMKISDFLPFLHELKDSGRIADFFIGCKTPIISSDDERILPLECPQDSLRYDPAIHPPKRQSYVFPYKIFAELVVELDVSGKGQTLLLDSRCPPTLRHDVTIFEGGHGGGATER